jgi:hypothetical protein
VRLIVKTHAVIFFFSLGLLSLIMSCDDSTAVVNPYPQFANDIDGIAYAYSVDSVGNQIDIDTGITVSVEGDSLTAKTDSLGLWSIAGLPNGTYNLDFSKPGYGEKKLIGVPFVSSSTAGYFSGNITLYPIPTYSVAGITDSISISNGYVYVDGTFSGALPSHGYAEGYVFFGTSSAVSSNPNNYLAYTYAGSNIYSCSNNLPSNSTFAVCSDTATFLNDGFKSGDTVYAIAYGGSDANNAVGYIDPATNKAVFTSLNPAPSNVVSFVLP